MVAERVEQNIEFINKFREKIYNFSGIVFNETNHNILNCESPYGMTKMEIEGLIILNKIFFQNIYSYFELDEKLLFIPSFGCLRAATENLRLLMVYTQDAEFRTLYLENTNTDYRKKSDREFMQSQILKRLDRIERDERTKNIIALTAKLQNHLVTRESTVSEIHSELSKWNHALNMNLQAPLFINSNKIYLGIDNEENEYSNLIRKKYCEFVFELLSIYLTTITFYKCSENLSDKFKELIDLYEEYIRLFY